ncbi:MAG: protoporphyrinogen oxidase [Chloroflexi bacterium]|nr:protoporphyrinogen oxidase [Chloroflexota bacterium]
MAPDTLDTGAAPLSAVIVGGGITGLSIAWYLEKVAREQGFDVSIVLVEREPSLGGKIRTHTEDGFVIEAGPDGFLLRKPWAIDLAEDLGLAEDIFYTQAGGASLLRNGKLHPIPRSMMGPAPASPRDVWRASFLSWPGRLRANLEPLVPKRENGAPESLGGLLSRRLGAELTDTLLEPLTAGIYGGDVYGMNAEVLFPTLRQWEQQYGSLTRGIRETQKAARIRPQPPAAFFSLRGGAQRLVEAIADRLERTEIVRGRIANAVERRQGDPQSTYLVRLDDGRAFDSGMVALATPARDAGGLVGSFAPGLARSLQEMQTTATGSVYLAFPREQVAHPLDSSGFLMPRSETGLVTGCTWMSSKWPGRSPEGHVLLRAFTGWARDASFLEYSDTELVEVATETLRPILGIRGAPDRSWVNRWEEGLPQYRVDHPNWLEEVDRELVDQPGLFLSGASYRGIGVPDCVRQGRETAERMAAFVTQRSPSQPVTAHGA